MFLFDKSRSGRQFYKSGNNTPILEWSCDLRTYPKFCAESTAVIDRNGNIYFGSHSGNFYSLTPDGKIRWTFTTKEKIYSSPLLENGQIYFAGGDGMFYCLNLEGDLLWSYDLSDLKGRFQGKKKVSLVIHFPFTYDLKKGKNIIYRSWSSPNYIDGRIFITAYGIGLYCFDPNGKVLWTYDLGFPRYQLSGVAIDEHESVYCASRAGLAYSFSKDGDLQWKRTIKSLWEPWGNPVVCTLNHQVIFFFALGEKKGLIHVVNYDGTTKWELKIGSIRGSCCISRDGEFIYCCDLDGFIYKIKASDGTLMQQKRITTAQRGLWITPTMDADGDLLLSTKDANDKGRVVKLTPELEIVWEFGTNKVLSVPVILQSGHILFGSWDGKYYAIKT